MRTARGARGATLLKRTIAWIVDAVTITALAFLVVMASGALIGPTVTFHPDAAALRDTVHVDAAMLILNTILTTLVSAAYVSVPLSRLGGSPAQLAIGLRVTDENSGSMLTLGRALKRWILVFPPFATIAAFTAGVAPLGGIAWIAAIAWYLVVAVTTASSPTVRGLHDRLLGDVVHGKTFYAPRAREVDPR
jgi:uncharacterized RDD family membrane protein YckC